MQIQNDVSYLSEKDLLVVSIYENKIRYEYGKINSTLSK